MAMSDGGGVKISTRWGRIRILMQELECSYPELLVTPSSLCKEVLACYEAEAEAEKKARAIKKAQGK